jgi:hypothetical protein
MGSIQLLMTAVQQLQPTLQPPTNLAAQVPAQSQHWQASSLPTVGGPSTFQPYAMAPPVTAPACGQLKVVHLGEGRLQLHRPTAGSRRQSTILDKHQPAQRVVHSTRSQQRQLHAELVPGSQDR